MGESSSKIFDIDWNIVVNLGIKCNTLGISRSAEVRYYSSPFDNMDTVEGLVETADLMSTGFANYFDDINEWEIKNEIAPRSTEIRNKIVWHKSTPNVYYPHFADVWFKETMTKDELHDWKVADNLTIEPVWEGMKRVFGNRQQRLASQLRSNNKILFFRADEKRQLKRVHSTNQDEHLEEFITKMQTAFPQTEIGLMYLYCNNARFERELSSSEYVHTELIPDGMKEDEYAIKRLGDLKVLPRDEMLETDFNVECNDTE
tara:strand:+ start:326 stop:1105 length:780 start_codon:yes stop_codon:yes gene_type:complete